MASMRALSACVAAWLLFGSGTGAIAYGQAAGGVQAPTTVQLPTFHQFSVNTSVLVPDRGATFLGGVDYSASGSTTRGVPGLSHIPGANRLAKNRSFGFETGRSVASVTAWIHDFAAMDAALLAEAAAKRGGQTADNSLGAPAAAARDRVSSSANRGDESLASIRARQSQERADLEQEALDLIAQGDAAKAAGKPGVAKIYYEMAARKSRQRRP